MIDDFAKEYLHNDLRYVRQVVIAKTEGLSEYDVRRPLTSTGTNLLGLVKHLAIWEAWYFGEAFGRPFPGPWLRRAMDAGHLNGMWATADERRSEILARYLEAWDHADATIAALAIDAPGHVPWWPRPEVKLFNVMVHMLNETNRHAGHADILREQLDGAYGETAAGTQPNDRMTQLWTNHCATIEQAARAAGASPV